MKELDISTTTFAAGQKVVVTYGFNPQTNKPFSFIYDFGYPTDRGYVVYVCGQASMPAARFFNKDSVRPATAEDLQSIFEGN